jgi:activator of HSP90 ATPase
MAEWGKGDPRWIVEERPDATNPNNWHWKEKNATQWSKDKLNELLVGLKIENEQLVCEIKELKKCDGEASANNRKAKLVFLYEWHIEGKWEGSVRTGENRTKYEGGFEIPNLSDENEIHEVTITFSIEKSKGEKLKELMKQDGEPIIRQKLGEYVRLLKEEFSQGLILPTKTSANTNNTKIVSTSSINTNTAPTSKPSSSSSSNTQSSSSSSFQTRDLTIEDTFKCTRTELFQTFTDINMVRAFTQNSVSQYDCQQGGKFSLFGDNITGNFLDIIPYDRIDMLWRFKSWPKEHFSHVSLQFQDDTDQTKLIIQQNGVPAQFYDNTMEGWKRFYLESIKSTFGYGARLL